MKRKATTRNVGLARVLSKLGYCSRSQAALLVLEGRVQVNGTVRLDPETPVRVEQDRIDVDDLPMGQSAKIYVVLKKPRGIVTTAADERGRDTVYSLLPKSLPWIAPVGRLDKASEGLLLLTNDTQWAARITAPESHLDKTYHVQVNSADDESITGALCDGVRVDVSQMFRAKRASLLRSGEKNCWIEVVLDEGKNRQIRRMLEQLDTKVLRLVRVAIGPLRLGQLAKGSSRALTPAEKQGIDVALDEAGRTHSRNLRHRGVDLQRVRRP